MKLTKIFHSCVLLEGKGLKILIDPGKWQFDENIVQAVEFYDIDAILVTHEHQDHYFPEALKEISRRVITNSSLARKMKEAGINAEALSPGHTISIRDLSIHALDCPHGPLPVPCPENVGFLIDNKILAPGDSLESKGVKSPEVLLAPVIAPWMRVAEGIDFVKHVKPKVVVPVHDGFMKYPFALNMFSRVLEEAGFNVQAKNPGESFEI